jgi:uncharacterized membrane protein
VIDGRTTLRGPVLAHEVPHLLAGVAAVAGVCDIDNQLDPLDDAGNVPALQGQCTARPPRFVLARENWPPSARLVGTVTGAALAAYGMLNGRILGKLLTVCGGALCLRSVTNLNASRLTGIGAGPRAVNLRKTITINAPIEDVFNDWGRFENLPRFMQHVQSVRDLGEGRSEWTVSGPGGTPIKWTARITEFRPYDMLAWETEPGSAVEHSGRIRFAPTPSGGTRLDICMSYNPPAGAIGHMVAWLLGSDPKAAMDQDFVRFKTLLEKSAGDNHTVQRGNLAPSPDVESSYGNPT